MTTVPWGGCFPVMLTPFTADGAIDGHGLDALIEWYLGHGATGLFACCQSSEIGCLGWEERLWLAERVVARVRGRVPVVGTGSLGIGDLAAEAACLRRFAETGVDATVIITGHVVPPEADDAAAVDVLERIAVAVPGVALGLYECPRPYKRLLSVAGVARLAAGGSWRYFKETACDPAISSAKARACLGTPLALFDACVAQVSSSLAAGAAGTSPILANLVPDLVAQLCAHPEPTLQAELTELGRLVEIGYPRAVKEAIAGEVAIHPWCRQQSSPGPVGHARALAQRVAELRARFAVGVHA